jgi:hypothetical protein
VNFHQDCAHQSRASALVWENANHPRTPFDFAAEAFQHVGGTQPAAAIASFRLVAPQTVWINPAYTEGGGNDGHIWGIDAFATIQAALDAVKAGGTVNVQSGTYSENLVIDPTVTLIGVGLPTLDASGGTAMTCEAEVSVNLTVKGFVIQNAGTVFSVGETCSLVAYANNISGFATAVTGAGSWNLEHNWWGVKHGAKPDFLSDAEWDARLGAPVLSWADGTDSALLGEAGLSGGTGLALIVDHGDEPPFISSSSETMCSDYYDFSVGNGGAGVWDASIPVNTSIGGCATTLDEHKMSWVEPLNVNSCATDEANCWVKWVAADQLQPGILTAIGIGTDELQGTPFVAGSSGGTDPTSIFITQISTRLGKAQGNYLLVEGFILLVFLAVILAWRKRFLISR